MIAFRRRAAFPLLTMTAIAVLAAACGPSPRTGPSTRPSAADPSAVPGGSPTPAVQQSITLPSTTETAFGRIWDALPPSFPKLPGQQPAETGAGPTSGSFAVNMTADAAAETLARALAQMGWTIDVASPLEDGTVVLDAGGAREGCAAEVRFTPLSGTVVMSVLYGAECPFS